MWTMLANNPSLTEFASEPDDIVFQREIADRQIG